MPQLGAGNSDYNLNPTDVTDIQPDFGTLFGNAVQQQYEQGPSPGLYDSWRVNQHMGEGPPMAVEDANQMYGLKLNPKMGGGTINQGLAEEFARRQGQLQYNEALGQSNQLGLAPQFAAGQAAMLGDPLMVSAQAAMAAATEGISLFGNLSKLPLFLNNPVIRGAIEGGGFQAAITPALQQNAHDFGRTYTDIDAAQDIAGMALFGGALHGIGAVGKKIGRVAGKIPADQGTVLGSTIKDTGTGDALNPERVVGQTQTLDNLQQAKQEVFNNSLDQAPNSNHQPVTLNEPESQAHQTPLEATILSEATSHIPLKEILAHHLSDTTTQLNQLAELMHEEPISEEGIEKGKPLGIGQSVEVHGEPGYITAEHGGVYDVMHLDGHTDYVPKEALDGQTSKGTFLQNLPQALKTNDQFVANMQSLNELLPEHERITPDKLTLNQTGILSDSAIGKLGKVITDQNNFVRDPAVPVDEKVTKLKAEHQDLSQQLRKAQQYLANARSRGTTTESKWIDKVGDLTPQLQHTLQLLQDLGEHVDTPELSLQNYMDAFQGHVSDAWQNYIKDNPVNMEDPVYRIRNNIFDTLRSRIDETEKQVRNTNVPEAGKSSLSPEDPQLKTLADSGFGETAAKAPEDYQKEVTQDLMGQIDGLRNLGIMDPKGEAELAQIEQMFTDRMQRVKDQNQATEMAKSCTQLNLFA